MRIEGMSRALTGAVAVALAGCAAADARPASATSVATARLGQRATLGRVAVTPLRVVEDSRCPSGVQCIQAGTVRLAARIRERGASREAVLPLGRPFRLAGGWLTLCAVRPYPGKAAPVARAAYRFRLAFGGDGPAACGEGG
jgi:hypothetical protein